VHTELWWTDLVKYVTYKIALGLRARC